jgi:hypothetical protein
MADVVFDPTASPLEPGDRAERQAFCAVGKIIQITSEMFGREVGVKYDYDPEFPEDGYVVFIVSPSGNPAELVAKEIAWAKAVSGVAKNWESFRLSIRPTP